MVEVVLSSGKKVEVKTLSFLEGLDISEGRDKPTKEVTLSIVKTATNLTDEDIAKLSMKEGIELIGQIVDINGLGKPEDFMKSKD